MKSKCIFLISLLMAVCSVFADLVPMTEDAMAQSTGQSLVLIEETTHAQPGSEIYEFTRTTLGLKIELNATIDEISLGTYHRNNGTECTGKGSFCSNTTGNYTAWNCSVSQCGGLTNDGGGNNTLSVSPLIYGSLYTAAGVGYSAFALTFDVLAKNYYSYSTKFDSVNGLKIFPSGFNYTTDTDIALRDVTFGRIIDNADGTQSIEDFVFEDPFVEFAYNQVGEVVGVKTGFGSVDGVQGNAIDVFTGFVQPIVKATASVLWGSGTFSFAPYLGGVRTPGYVDPNKTYLVGACSSSGATGGAVCAEVNTVAKVATASPQAQLFPLQAIVLNESPAFWISVQSEDVDYPNDVVVRPNGQTVEYNYETAKAGVWFNLGALSLQVEGGAVRVADFAGFADYTGLSVSTSQPLHPDNYYNANSNSATYPQTNNYY